MSFASELLSAIPPTTESFRETAEHDGRRVEIIYQRDGAAKSPDGHLEKLILEIVGAADQPMVRKRIHAALESKGWRYHPTYLGSRLSEMYVAGLLGNLHNGRGYYVFGSTADPCKLLS